MLLSAFGKYPTNAMGRSISNISFYFSCRKDVLKSYFTCFHNNNYIVLNALYRYSVPLFSHQTTRANMIYYVPEKSQIKWHV